VRVLQILEHEGEMPDALVHDPLEKFAAVLGELMTVLLDRGGYVLGFHQHSRDAGPVRRSRAETSQ
jgi:hypothetical protein